MEVKNKDTSVKSTLISNDFYTEQRRAEEEKKDRGGRSEFCRKI